MILGASQPMGEWLVRQVRLGPPDPAHEAIAKDDALAIRGREMTPMDQLQIEARLELALANKHADMQTVRFALQEIRRVRAIGHRQAAQAGAMVKRIRELEG